VDTLTAETIATPSVALDATVAGSPHVEGVGGTTGAGATGASLRTTVLPRVEIVDAKPRLVTDRKRRFEPIRPLGEGGHGEVMGARDNDIGRNVAVKRLRPELKSPAVALRFAEEVRTVGQLEHPNIVPIHDVGLDENGDYYFVMKYVDGETLEAVIEKLAAGDAQYHASYGFERRVQIFTAILEAVAFAHSKGIIHRDIKPANVMIGPYGEVALMDWGVARRPGTQLESRPGEVIGTPAYMSPEQARGEPADERSDIYSLSVLFHELLCLTHPLAHKTTVPAMLHGVANEPVPHTAGVGSPHQPPTPAELSWFVQKGVKKDPKERFQSVPEMLDRLARRAEGSFPIQCPITFSKRVLGMIRRFVDRHPAATMAILSSLGLAFIALVATATVLAIRR
jgi:serine/threonine-protein kinase